MLHFLCTMSSSVITERYGSTARQHEYVLSKHQWIRLDRTTKFSFRGVLNLLEDLFLPQGYPDSVTEDYLPYQMWDTLQAFASSIIGTLSTQAVLKGVGVGSESATLMAATIIWLLRDGSGMVGRIIFAWARGSQLDSDSKRWRLFADVLNDLSFFVDLVAPYCGSCVTLLLCISGVFRAIVGVAGGATRAALTQHQAQRNNLADVSAKDGSQETLVNLAALICSLILIPVVTGKTAIIWLLFVVLTAVHLFANYNAVRSLCMTSLNRARYSILVRHFLKTGNMLGVSEANRREPLVMWFFGWRNRFTYNFGCPFSDVIDNNVDSNFLWNFYSSKKFIIRVKRQGKRCCFAVALKENARVHDMLEAAFFVEHFVHQVSSNPALEFMDQSALYQSIASPDVTLLSSKFRKSLENAGWNLDYCLLGFDDWRILESQKYDFETF